MESVNKQAILKIDLGIVAENYLYLKKQLKPNTTCAVVVKANAYGLGAKEVAAKLYECGCRDFYVAYFSEALDIKDVVGASNISVLHGFVDADVMDFKREEIIPVLNSVNDIEMCKGFDIPVSIHVDTGMNRLGFNLSEALKYKDAIAKLNVRYLMSHLACAEDSKNPKNKKQLEELQKAIRLLNDNYKVSFANSSGVFLGEEYHFDEVRAGCALYGLNPCKYEDNVLKNAISLKAKILQIRKVHEGETTGYGASYKISEPKVLATIAVGYADGLPRVWGDEGMVYIKDQPAKIVGKISMDSLVIDITTMADKVNIGDWVEIVGDNQDPDDIAKQAKTIGYEILTSIGSRYQIIYKD